MKICIMDTNITFGLMLVYGLTLVYCFQTCFRLYFLGYINVLFQDFPIYNLTNCLLFWNINCGKLIKHNAIIIVPVQACD